jgi:hypothetical protein
MNETPKAAEWRLVPFEPTEQMLEAAAIHRHECYMVDRTLKTTALWSAMLAASPTAAPKEEAERLGAEIKACLWRSSQMTRIPALVDRLVALASAPAGEAVAWTASLQFLKEHGFDRVTLYTERARAAELCTEGHNPVALYTSPSPAEGKEPMTGCQCEACYPHDPCSPRMILCETCGNKRCPHATDHRNACTNSNEPGQPGQPGSAYAGIHPAKEKE